MARTMLSTGESASMATPMPTLVIAACSEPSSDDEVVARGLRDNLDSQTVFSRLIAYCPSFALRFGGGMQCNHKHHLYEKYTNCICDSR